MNQWAAVRVGALPQRQQQQWGGGVPGWQMPLWAQRASPPPQQWHAAAMQQPQGAGMPHSAQQPGRQQQQQQPSSSGGGPPLSPDSLQRRRQQEALEDEQVHSACFVPPQLADVRESFATQREAFDAADRHNGRWMPLLPQPTVVASQVPAEELLPVSGSAAAAAAQQGPASSSSGARGSGSAGSRGQPINGQEADSAVAAPPPAGDFLSRFRQGALPPPDSSGYNMAPLEPLLKRQREEAEAEQARQQQQQEAASRAAREYETRLRELRQAAAAEQQQQPVVPGGALQHLGQPAGPASTGDQNRAAPPQAAAAAGSAAAAAAAPAGQDQHQEAVRAFCVERRGR